MAKWENGLAVPNPETLKELNTFFDLVDDALVLDKDNEKNISKPMKISYSIGQFFSLFKVHLIICGILLIFGISHLFIAMARYDNMIANYDEIRINVDGYDARVSRNYHSIFGHELYIYGMKNHSDSTKIPAYMTVKPNGFLLSHSAKVTTVDLSGFGQTYLTIPYTVDQLCILRDENNLGITGIHVDSLNKTYYSESNCILTKDKNDLVYVSNSGIIPRTVNEIESRAFAYYNNYSIVIPKETKRIMDLSTSHPVNFYLEFSEEEFNNKIYYKSTVDKKVVWFYSESKPVASGNYWHYDSNGNVICWEE